MPRFPTVAPGWLLPQAVVIRIVAVGPAGWFICYLISRGIFVDVPNSVARHGFAPFAYWRIAVDFLGLVWLQVAG